MDKPFNLSEFANMMWPLNSTEIESIIETATQMLAVKRTMEGSEGKLAQSADRKASDDLRDLRHFLSDERLDLSGPECVLLGSLLKYHQNNDVPLDTRSLNVELDSFGRKPSNTTSTVENLEKKELMEFVTGEDRNAHKTFCLTEQGHVEVRDLMSRLARKSFSAVS